MTRSAALISALGVLVAGCGGSAAAPDTVLQEGVWGGVGIQMTVTAARTTFDFGCDVGTIDGPVILDAAGGFSVSGIYAFGRGGPRQPGEPPLPTNAARYGGRSSGRTLSLTVSLPDLARKIGDFELALGRRPELDRCL